MTLPFFYFFFNFFFLFGSVYRTETMHRLLCNIPNHFAFKFGRYLFLAIVWSNILMWMLTIVIYIQLTIAAPENVLNFF